MSSTVRAAKARIRRLVHGVWYLDEVKHHPISVHHSFVKHPDGGLMTRAAAYGRWQ